MRYIRKRVEPLALREWRARYQSDINFGYTLMRLDHNVTEAVLISLLEEQGFLCAYTGRRIERTGCHIEHLNAQSLHIRGEDVEYTNIVACYPAPNTGEAPYGAHQKKNWPAPAERHLFVSPLTPDCESRFRFNLRGEITPSSNDIAAEETIRRLKLDHSELTALRREAIKSTLGPDNGLPLDKARQRLRSIEEPRNGKLDPYCFALKQALEKHIKRLEAIRESKRAHSKPPVSIKKK